PISSVLPVGDAPAIDGKLVVGLDTDVDPHAVAEELARRIRHIAPALGLEATWAPATTWADLPPDAARHRLAFPHLGVDLPLARRCDLCRVDAATDERTITGELRRICRDCSVREDR